jgi:hypothetical protein
MVLSSDRADSKRAPASMESTSKKRPFKNKAESAGCRLREDKNESWFFLTSFFKSADTAVLINERAWVHDIFSLHPKHTRPNSYLEREVVSNVGECFQGLVQWRAHHSLSSLQAQFLQLPCLERSQVAVGVDKMLAKLGEV